MDGLSKDTRVTDEELMRDMSPATLGDIINHPSLKKDRDDEIMAAIETVLVGPETPAVDRMMAKFDHQWQTTADICIRRAIELEEEASRLRQQASYLLECCQLTQAVKDTVVYEINARNNAARLALVNPSE